MKLKTKTEITLMRAGGRILRRVLNELSQNLKPGVSLKELDLLARNLIAAAGAVPAFLNYQPAGARLPYPAAICASLDSTVVHGLPTDYRLKNDDLISIDLGVKFQGLFTDAAFTKIIGEGSPNLQKLLRVTKECLILAVKAARPGATLGDLGHAIESHAVQNGFNVIKLLTGHGVGHALHEEPTVYNFGSPGEGLKLKAGLTLAIEPMLTSGSGDIRSLPDDSYVTADGAPAAHFEHTIAITAGAPLILTE